MNYIYVIVGHETTASVLSWSIYALGKYKLIQDKVYREVKRVIGDKQHIDGQVEFTQVQVIISV